MDQVKEFLRQVVKYRFWISIAVATLFAGGAYVLGSGPIQKNTEDTTAKINSAAKDVQNYTSSSVPTADFEPVVAQKTEVLTKDVDVAWKELYERQAPLLTWPESVASRFQKWGRKWPEEADASGVQLAIIDYVYAYPAYVKTVFETFKPFNYETGEGIVASAPSEMLLRPTTFDLNKRAPKLNEVWSSQERLWVQRTVLEVVNNVNRNATDWESAYLKEIKALEVGNIIAQDQKSLAKGDVLEAADPIVAPDEPEEDAEGGGDMGSGSGGSMMMSAMMGSAMGSGSGGMLGSGMGGMGGVQVSQDVLFLKPEGTTQYKILPIMITVLIDQDHVQDLLVELENSPMTIEVKEPEIRRPQSRVIKPEKGVPPMGFGGGMMGMMGGGMMGRDMMMGGGAMGYGGMNSMMMNNMMMPGMMGGRGGMDMMNGMMGGMGGMGAAAQKKGEDKRSFDRAKSREEELKKIETITGKSLFDPYFNIVELTVYGQARFYNEPPPPEAAEPTSPGDAEAAPGDQPAEAAAAAPGDQPAEATTPAASPETAPAEAPQTEAPKAETPAATPDAAAAPADPAQPDPAAAPAAPQATPETPKP